jgi:hypothetical protein
MTDPRRLRDGHDDLVVASLLDAARAYHRPAASRHRILKMLGLPVAFSVGVPAAAIASSLGAKLVLIVSTATVVVAGGGAVAYRAHVRSQAREAAVVANHRATTATAQRRTQAVEQGIDRAAAPVVDAPSVAELAPLPVVVAPARSTAPAVKPQAREPTLARPSSPPTGRLALNEVPMAPSSPPQPEPVAPTTPFAPPPVAFSMPELPTRSSSPRDLPPVAAAARQAPLARELALLDLAEQAERRRDYRGALAGVEAYTRECPGGALRAEAEVLRIAALFGACDTAAARAYAREFLAHSSPSPLTARVASMLSRASGQDEKKELP